MRSVRARRRLYGGALPDVRGVALVTTRAPLTRGCVAGVSFDYGHVLGGLDLGELARRIDRIAAPVVARVDDLEAAMAAAYAAHDAAIARDEGHERAWRALMAALVSAGGVAASERSRVVEALWRMQPTSNLWRRVPDEARAMLDWLRDRGVPMVVTSNSEGRVAELLAEVTIDHYFKRILDSGRLGFGKPEPQIFMLAADALGLPMSRVVHVGDSEKADVVGARAAGVRAVRFDGFNEAAAATPTVADARTAHYAELRAILAEILDIEA